MSLVKSSMAVVELALVIRHGARLVGLGKCGVDLDGLAAFGDRAAEVPVETMREAAGVAVASLGIFGTGESHQLPGVRLEPGLRQAFPSRSRPVASDDPAHTSGDLPEPGICEPSVPRRKIDRRSLKLSRGLRAVEEDLKQATAPLPHPRAMMHRAGFDGDCTPDRDHAFGARQLHVDETGPGLGPRLPGTDVVVPPHQPMPPQRISYGRYSALFMLRKAQDNLGHAKTAIDRRTTNS
jgi:hypothetical protein